jgi:hypothetical protein
MNLKDLIEKALIEKLNQLVESAQSYFYFFFNWGFFYWNAGTLTYKYKKGNYQTF